MGESRKDRLIGKLREREAVVAIIGLGYVGLPLVLRFVDEGFRVIGFDVDRDKIDALQQGRSYIRQFSDESIAAARDSGFSPTDDPAALDAADAIVICVPTPLGVHRDPDLNHIVKTAETIAPRLRAGQVVSLESTTYPGTTEEVVLPILEREGLEVGRDWFLVYSPERVDPGNRDFPTRAIPKVLGGISRDCLEVGRALYEGAFDTVVPVSSTQVAEMTKLLENIHRAVNIGLVNEMKIVADRMGIDIYEVVRAAATKPFGFVPYYPGPGLGGHCIPIDPFYLTWKAREYGVDTRFIKLAGQVNSDMPFWVYKKLVNALNLQHKSVMGSRILILGLAYKKNTDDLRESPAVVLMDLLGRDGAEVAYFDPHIPEFKKMRKYDFDLRSVELSAETLRAHDAVLLITDHDGVDYDLVARESRLVVDTRGVYSELRSNIVRA